MRLKKSGLFKRYFKVSVSILLASILVLGISLLTFISNFWKHTKVDLLYENVKTVSRTAKELFGSGNVDYSNNMAVLILGNMLNITSTAIEADVFICNLDGEIVLYKDLLADSMGITNDGNYEINIKKSIPKKILERFDDESYYLTEEISNLSDDLQIIVGQKIENQNGNIIGYVVAVEPVVAGLKPFITGMLRMFIFAALITIVLTSAVVYVFTYSVTKPLQEMSSMTKNYARGDFSKRLQISDNDELGELAGGLNSMAQSLATLESSRRSFVANISHELKTPMTTISGFIDGILDGTIPPEKQDHYLGVVSDEVKRLSRLVVSMLNLSKIEDGKLELKSNKFDLSQMFFNILLTFEQRIDKKHIVIDGLNKMHSVNIVADQDLIYQVVYNLVDNAVKFTDDGGSIGVYIAEESDRVIVGIRNTGVGIPSDEVNMIFERFYKVDKSRSEDVKGTGLGLYLTKSIVEMHGGQIAVRSKQEEYTEFIFWIPKSR